MSLECSECERDLRAGHDPSCSRYDIVTELECEAEDSLTPALLQSAAAEIARLRAEVERFKEACHYARVTRHGMPPKSTAEYIILRASLDGAGG